MVHDIAAANTLLNLDQAEVHAWAELVQPQSHISVLFLILKVVRQLNLGTRQVIDLRLRAVASLVLVVASTTLIFAVQHVVSNIIVAGQVRHLIFVHQLLDTPVDLSLSRTHAVMSEFDLVVIIQIEQNDAFASRKVHGLDLQRWEHRLDHQ